MVEDLSLCCNVYSQSKSVIIMDNCQTDTKARMEEAVLAADCEINSMPPYSPDFNPIELTFNVLKDWIRRYYGRASSRFDDFEAFLRYATARASATPMRKRTPRIASISMISILIY